MSRILWCITGAGGQLRRIFQAFREFRSRRSDVEVGVALSRAAEDVARIYGILDRLKEVSSGGRYGGIYRDASWSGITEDGVPLGGRISLNRYSLVVIAPASSNTIAKIAAGIADTLPTTSASQAIKSRTPLIIFPADHAGHPSTTLPCIINGEKCTCCLLCVNACPYGAIRILPSKEVKIDYNRCRGCGRCEDSCEAGAISCWEEREVTPNPIDLENISKIKGISGLHVVTSLDELISKIEEILGFRSSDSSRS